MAEVDVKEEKKSNAFKYIIIFLIFFAIGAVGGFYGAKKYFENKDNNTEETIVEEGPEDITDVDEYKELVNKLYVYIDGNPMFYTTTGVLASTMNNESRLSYVFDNLDKAGKVESTSLSASYGTNNCLNKFNIEPSATIYSNTNTCSVRSVDRKLFNDINKTYFNDELIDTSVSFVNSYGETCIVSEDKFICGVPLETNRIFGKLISKFEIVKVTKEEGTIVIYDKGYLVDERNTINNPGDGHDAYYLHSSDSKSYYYELKNADNLTFKHTFVTKDRVNYYYVSSELVKE